MKPIKNASGQVLAYEHDGGQYRQELRDTSGKLLAYYNPHIDRTFTPSGKMVGTGDQRGRFIPDK
jgi:hypothetical protein